MQGLLAMVAMQELQAVEVVQDLANRWPACASDRPPLKACPDSAFEHGVYGLGYLAPCLWLSPAVSFNTSSSMGRLTLNVLLSFAQFEREVIGERVRDKIAASKC